MKKNYLISDNILYHQFTNTRLIWMLFLLFNSFYSFSQDCSIQKSISDDTICIGQTATIVLSNSEATVNYQLRDGTTNVGSPVSGTGSAIVFNVSPTATTVYNVIAVGCPSSYTDEATVTVNPQPNAGVDGNTTVCDSNAAVIDLSGLLSGEDSGGIWTRTSGSGGNFNASSGTFTPAIGATSSTFLYTLTALPPCTDDSSEATVFINPSSTPSVSVSASPGNAICSGTLVSFTATPVNGGSNPVFQWMVNGINAGTNSPFFSSNTLNNTDKVTVEMVSSATCSLPSTVTSNSITMTVNDIVTPSVSITASQTTICPGDWVTFSALAINGGNNPNYQWKVNNGAVGTNSSNFSTSTLADGAVVTVTLTSNAVCASPISTDSNSITITVKAGTPSTPGVITGTSTVCPNLSGFTYSINPVPNATNYNWTVPAGWNITGGLGTSAITVATTGSAVSGNISVAAENSCGTSTANNLAVSASPAAPVTPGAVSGTTTVCPDISGLTYSVNPVPNATTYNWTVPAGWNITGGLGTNVITVSTTGSAVSGNIGVTAANSCGTSTANNLAVSVSPAAPVTPGTVSGTTTVCPDISGLTYSVNPVPNATTYNWTVPAGWNITGGLGTSTITVTTTGSAVSGNIGVTAANSCGTSTANNFAVTVSPAAPVTPGAVSGTTTVCPDISGLTYSVNPVPNATSYNWTVPAGWNITGGLGTSAITVANTGSAVSGNIGVTAANSCGTSTASNLAVSVSPAAPVTPGAVSGTATVCPDISGLTYSINPVPNVTTYNWTLPSGWNITGGLGTNAITVATTGSAVNGNIGVTAANSCGTSTPTQLAVSVSPAAPVTPGAVSGTTTVCPDISGLTYSINPVPNATTYNWTVPAGWNITGGLGTNAITVATTSSAMSGNIGVTAANSCGTSTASNLAVSVSPAAPGTPGAILGASEQCINQSGLSYSIAAVPNATSYSWTLPAGWTITSGTTTPSIIAATSGSAVSGTISVTASNSCGSSSVQTFPVTVSNGIPGATPMPKPATGQASSICPVATGLSYSIPAVANATSYTWNVPSGWTITSGQGTTSITADAGVQSTGNKNITVTASNACGSTTSPNFEITIGTFAYVNVGADQIVCSGTSTILLNATPGGATNINNDLLWSAPSGTFSNNRKFNPTYTIDNSLVTNGGTVVITATVRAEGSCGTSSDAMTLTVLPPLTAAITGNTTLCSGENTAISFTATPNTILTYTVSGVSGTSNITIDASGTAVLTTPPLSNTTIYTLTNIAYATSPSCAKTITGSVTVTVNPASVVNPGGPDTSCQSMSPSAITLAGATVSGGATTGAWSITSGGGTLSTTAQTATPHMVTYTPIANFTGTVTLSLTTNAANGCVPVSATRTLTVNPASTVTAWGPTVICQSNNPTPLALSGASVGGGATSGAWTITSGGGNLSNSGQTNNPESVTYTPDTNYTGMVSLVLTTNAANGCSPVSATRTITINPASTVTAGGPTIICQSANPSAIMLSGATIGGGATTGAWTITSGGGSLSTTNQTATPDTVTYTPVTNFSGTVILSLTTNAANGCSPVSATRTITINPASTVIAGGPDTICQSSTPTALTLSGASIGGGATTGAWSITSGSGSLSSTSQTATPDTVTFTPAANFTGAVTLTLTTNTAVGCTPVSATRTLTINPASTVTAGSAATICQSATPAAITLTGASIGGGATTGTWAITSGGGTLSTTAATTTPETVTYTPAANFSGIVTLTLSANAVNGCTTVSATKTLTINAASTVTAGGPDSVCQSDNPTAITLAGASVGGGATMGSWTITSGGGTLSTTSLTTTPETVTYTPEANFSGTVSLTLTTNAADGCTPVSAIRTITINPVSIVTAGGPDTICQSDNPTAFTLSGASVSGGASTGAWTIISGGGSLSNTGQTNNPETVTYTPAANYSGTVLLTLTTNAANGCTPVSATRTISIPKKVLITSQPSNTSICASFPVDLYVVAIGDGISYQWYKGTAPSGVAVSNTSNISGAQSSNLHFNQASLSDDGSYYVIVSGQAPCDPVFSAQRTLNVDQAIIISDQPVSQSLCSGSDVTFSVTADANGDALSYQWRKNGSPISGATTSSLSLNNITSSDTADYDVLISGPSGYTCTSVQSVLASLLVKPNPVVSANPITATICSGTSTSILLTSTVPGTTFSWTVTSTDVTGASDGNGNSISQILTATQTFPGTAVYTVTPLADGCTGNPVTITITVNPEAQLNQPTNQLLCHTAATAAIIFETVNSGGTTTYSWSNSDPSIGLAASGTGDIPSFTAVNNGTSPITATITVTPTFTNGGNSCVGTPKTFTLTINPSSQVNPPSPQVVCNGEMTTDISFGTTNSGGTTTYAWTNTVPSIGLAASGTGNIPSFTAVNNSTSPVAAVITVTPTYTNGGLSCTGTSETFTITVNPSAQVDPSENRMVCHNTPTSAINFQTINTAGTTTFSWTNSNPSIGLSATGNGNLPSFTAINTGTSPLDAVITVTPHFENGGISCTGNPETFTITVNPSAQVHPIPHQTVCHNSLIPTISFGTANSGGTTTYSWTNSNPSIGLAASGNGAIPAFTAFNSGTAPTVATLTVTPTFSNGSSTCTGAPETFTLTVHPSGQINQPVNQTLCNNGQTTAIVFATSNSGGTTTYSWTNSDPSIGLAATGTGDIPSFTAVNTGNTSIDATITVNPTFTNGGVSCIGNSKTFTLTVDATPIGGSVTTTAPNVTPAEIMTTVCHSATGSIYLSGQLGSVIRWEYSTNGGVTWAPIPFTGTTYNYTNLTITTFFRAVVTNGLYCTEVFSVPCLINVIPNIKPNPVIASPSVICNGQSTTLMSQSGYATSQVIASGGAFNTANPAGWEVDGGVFSAGADNGNPTTFLETNGNAGTEYDTASNDKFAIVRGNLNSIMETPVFNTLGLTTARLSFDYAYKLLGSAWAKVELSLDGGATYPIVLANYGPGNQGPYNPFTTNMSIDMDAYIGQSNLRIRFNYQGTTGSSWALDNIKIAEPPIGALTTEWLDINTGQVISTSNSTNLIVSPTETTTYAVTSYINGCTSFGPEGTTYLTVTVHQRPESTISEDQTICYGGSATFTVDLTGAAPWNITYEAFDMATGTNSFTTVNNISATPYVFTVNNITSDKTYTISSLNDSNCTSISADLNSSATVTVLNGTPGVWTGRVSNDWFDCMNWEKGLPSSTINALIPTNPTGNRMPVIDPNNSVYAAAYSNIASAQDLIIEPNASVSMAVTGNSDLHISRDWKNSGTFIPGDGTVTFNGSTNNQVQTINEWIKNYENFFNLTLNNSNGAIGIMVADGFELTVSNDLALLNGDLRLTGEAQLVQKGNSANPNSGSGKLFIDQQGLKNSLNYNYWCSPVASNGLNYTISGVLRDGTYSADFPFDPYTITFGDGYDFADGALTSPIKISNRWLHKYTSVSTVYAGWQYTGSTGTIKIGEGFTMKGPTGVEPFFPLQNYVFTGKPNNGTIALSIALDQSYLIGNPYSSALDADEFIKDNIKDGPGRATSNIFNGALYFWDHFQRQSHYLEEYIGGYATYTLMGGVVAVSNDPLINDNGATGTKIPKRYIPVAQGFFIGTGSNSALTTNNPNLSTAITGGTITIKNSQRVFQIKSDANSIFFKNKDNTTTANTNSATRKKIRLLYASPTHLYRQLLIGTDENTTDFFDIGYDAPMIDVNSEDMYWTIDKHPFVIQAVADFNTDRIIPIGIISETEGLNTIKISGLENIPDDLMIYIHDNASGTYTNIKDTDFTVFLAPGTYSNRFTLRFKAEKQGLDASQFQTPLIYFTNSNNLLHIKNRGAFNRVTTIRLYNLLGQLLNTFNAEEKEHHQISLDYLPSGTYIVKTTTVNGMNYSKQIVKQ